MEPAAVAKSDAHGDGSQDKREPQWDAETQTPSRGLFVFARVFQIADGRLRRQRVAPSGHECPSSKKIFVSFEASMLRVVVKLRSIAGFSKSRCVGSRVFGMSRSSDRPRLLSEHAREARPPETIQSPAKR